MQLHLSDNILNQIKKSLAIALALLTACLIVLSSFYIAEEHEHDCSGEECPICACIEQCEILLQRISSGAAFLCAVLLPLILVTILCIVSSSVTCSSDLVSLKVRLND